MSMLAWLIYYSGGHIYMMAIRAFVVWLRLQRRDWPMHICAGEERWADFFLWRRLHMYICGTGSVRGRPDRDA